MKKLIVFLGALGVLLTACRTSEANYRAAYEKTMEARKASREAKRS